MIWLILPFFSHIHIYVYVFLLGFHIYVWNPITILLYISAFLWNQPTESTKITSPSLGNCWEPWSVQFVAVLQIHRFTTVWTVTFLVPPVTHAYHYNDVPVAPESSPEWEITPWRALSLPKRSFVTFEMLDAKLKKWIWLNMRITWESVGFARCMYNIVVFF